MTQSHLLLMAVFAFPMTTLPLWLRKETLLSGWHMLRKELFRIYPSSPSLHSFSMFFSVRLVKACWRFFNYFEKVVTSYFICQQGHPKQMQIPTKASYLNTKWARTTTGGRQRPFVLCWFSLLKHGKPVVNQLK